jgi:hypothetical protein
MPIFNVENIKGVSLRITLWIGNMRCLLLAGMLSMNFAGRSESCWR